VIYVVGAAVLIVMGFVLEARARDKDVSSAAWLPLFWIVICASRSVSQWLSILGIGYFNAVDYGHADANGSSIDKIVLTIAIVLGLFIICRRRGALRRLVNGNKPLFVFVAFLGMTVLWSDIPEASFRRWIRLMGSLVIAGVLIVEPDPITSLRVVLRRFAYFAIPLSVLFVKYLPNLGTLYTALGERMWVGIALMKNGLGHLCLVTSFVLIWEVIIGSRLGKSGMTRPRVFFDLMILAMSLWLLKGPGGSNSSAALGCLILGTLMLACSRLPVVKTNFRRIGLFAGIAATYFWLAQSTFGVVEGIVTSLGRNMTFTDRTPLWSTLVDLGSTNLLGGFGYGGFWTDERAAYVATKAGTFRQAHNGYLEIFIEGGVVAIVLLCVALVSVFRSIQRSSDYESGVFRLCLFTIVLLANVTESSFARERDLLTFVFFLIALAKPIAINQTINAPRGAALPAGGDTAPWRPDVVSKA